MSNEKTTPGMQIDALVQKLNKLAEEIQASPYLSTREALREAAKALCSRQEKLVQSLARNAILVKERDAAIKRAEGAECAANINALVGVGLKEDFQKAFQRAEKAEAEAATLREAAQRLVASVETGDFGVGHIPSQALVDFGDVLSQPGPGAAYQEYVQNLEEALRWYGSRAATNQIPSAPLTEIWQDRGERANQALASLKGPVKPKT